MVADKELFRRSVDWTEDAEDMMTKNQPRTSLLVVIREFLSKNEGIGIGHKLVS